MLTQCPSCQTVFRVTPAILRAAHGQVRCGRCNMQFDAVEQLLDADEHEIAATQTALKSLSEPASADTGIASSSTSVAHEDIVLEGNRIEISGVYPGAALENDPDLAHTRTIIEEIDLSGDDWQGGLLINDEYADAHVEAMAETELEDVEEAISEVDLSDALNSLDADGAAEPAEPVAAITTIPSTTSPASSSGPTDTSRSLAEVNPWLQMRPASSEEVPLEKPAAPRRWPWMIASLVLCLTLVAQALHHYRQALARHPGYGPTLTQLYASLGQPLTPQWDLNAYAIQQWGMVSDPQLPGSLRVRASVTNRASFAQPYPLLQISLEDRFGVKIGSRAFMPAEYLGNAAQATRLLAAGESANIDLAIVDPGEAATGFQFDTCLNSATGLRCSHSSGS